MNITFEGDGSNESNQAVTTTAGSSALLQSGSQSIPVANTTASGSQWQDAGPTMIGDFESDLDVDAIIHSFMQDPQMQNYLVGNVQHPGLNTYSNGSNASMLYNSQDSFDNVGYSLDDALFGFNASALEWFNPNGLGT